MRLLNIVKPKEDLGQAAPADMSTIYTFFKNLQEHGLIRGEQVTVRKNRLVKEGEPLL
jgi:DNA-binding PadR family transcriptional regulator